MIAPREIDYYIEQLTQYSRNINYAEIEGILTFSAKYLREFKKLLDIVELSKFQIEKPKLKTIKCIHYCEGITIGKEYKVLDENCEGYYWISSDYGEQWNYSKNMFIELED